MREMVVAVLKQLDAWKTLHGFCVDLPIFKKLQEDKTFLSGSVTEGGGSSVDTLIERCRHVHVHMYMLLHCTLYMCIDTTRLHVHNVQIFLYMYMIKSNSLACEQPHPDVKSESHPVCRMRT